VQSYFWKRLAADQDFYRYQQHLGDSPANPGAVPVIFLQPLPPELATAMAEMFWADGFNDIYVYMVKAIDNEAALILGEAIEWLMHAYHPEQQRIVLVGSFTGGLLARRYVAFGGYERVAYLFTLGSQHHYSQLAYLRGSIFESREGAEEPPPVAAPALDDTVQVNIYSELAVASSERVNQFIHLPDAVNISLPLGEEALCRDRLTYQAMRGYLQGSLWLITVRLKSLEMRGGVEANTRTGPFCFEVNGWRAPFDGVLRVPLEKRYEFDPARTLLGTLMFPLTAAGRAVDIDFRLKDLSPRTQQRRKLLTSLHTPLHQDLVSEHVLQDSLGSEVGIQVRCDRPRPVLEAENE
jgi:hypothetical protein